MTCADFETLLDEQFGPALLRDDPALSEHAAACNSCRTQWEQQRLLADAIGAWREQAPDVDLTAAVMAGLERPSAQHNPVPASIIPLASSSVSIADRQPHPRKTTIRTSTTTVIGRSRRSLAAVAVSLTAMVAVVALSPLGRDVSRPAHSVVLSPPVNVGKAPQLTHSTDARNQNPRIARTDDIRAEQPAPYAGLVQLAAGAWDEVTLFVAPESKNMVPEQSPQAEAKDGWIDGLQHQLKPMGRGLDNAFDFLWQAGQSGDG